MRSLLLNVFVASLCLLAFGRQLFAMPSAKEPFVVVIDPGHGGRDSGAVRGHLEEARICLDVAKDLAQLLKQNARFHVVLTRDQNQTLSLEERVAIANSAHANIMLSLHANVALNKDIAGPEFYFENQLPPDEYEQYLANRENQSAHANPSSASSAKRDRSDVDEIINDLERTHRIAMSGRLAEILQQNWARRYPYHTRQVRQAPFYVITNVHAPSALIEMGYLSNSGDAHRLSSPSYQRAVAMGIYKSLVEFKELLDKREIRRLD